MSLPSVSCILPCGYGDEYVGLAIQCFMDQTYEGPLELVIVDNNDEPGPAFTSERVKYVRAPRGKTVGEYRNLGTQHATGEICITWDEDDWSSAASGLRQGSNGLAQHPVLGYDDGDFVEIFLRGKPQP